MGKILSVIPAFELGLWNAWILVLPMLLIFFFAIKVTAARESGEAGDFQLTKKEKRIINAIFLPMIVAFVYAVFLPLQSATAWLISGFVTYLFGIVFIIAAIRNFATSPKNRLVTNGVYRLSRVRRFASDADWCGNSLLFLAVPSLNSGADDSAQRQFIS